MHRPAAVLPFILGIVVGVMLGTLVVAFLAVSAYDRGYRDALELRGFRAQLRARRAAPEPALLRKAS